MQDTIPAAFLARARAEPDAIASYSWENGRFRPRTWGESHDGVAAIADTLRAAGLRAGDRVALVAQTRIEWTAIDLAVLSLGGVMVGIYPTLTAAQVGFQIRRAGCTVVIVENQAQGARLQGIALPKARFCIDPAEGFVALPTSGGDRSALQADIERVRADQLATLIFTSGTTGDPKGAMITHGSFMAVARASQSVAPLAPGDRSVIFLPLAHSLQRFTLYRGLIERGVQGVYARSLDDLPEAIAFAKPTVLASVPRMLEKIKSRAEGRIADARPPVHAAYRLAMRAGAMRVAAEEAQRPLRKREQLAVALADRLVFRRIRDALGGRIRYMVCGGAALDPEVARWYFAIGVPVREGWGLTETCAPATSNREGATRIGTVGQPLPDVEVKCDADGELLVRGPGLFRGYWQDDEATKAAFTDGWFRTGDIGTIDADGYVTITDRKKEILVTAGGKNIPPVNIEQRLTRAPIVAQAVVVGDAKPHLAALLVLDPDELARIGSATEAVAAAVAAANADLAPFEQVKTWQTTTEPFSVESGELTPTLKLRRRVIAERRADLIARLYR